MQILYKKFNKVGLRFIILILVSLQILMFLFLMFNGEYFEPVHSTFKPFHDKFYTAFSALPLLQLSVAVIFWISTIFLLVTIIFGYFYEVKQKSLLKSSLNQAELTALKARIQLHFLFNTLNTIIYLIEQNQDKAIETTQRLAELYRYILRISETETIQLKEELDCIRQYLLIEQERFGDRLKFKVDLPGSWLDRDIPGLILQPLIENCVRHGIGDTLENGKIEISYDENQNRASLVIKDNGVGMGALKLKNLLINDRYGLKNVNERWLLFTGNPLRIESEPGKGTCCYLDW